MKSTRKNRWHSDPLLSYATGLRLNGLVVERPRHDLANSPEAAIWAEIVFVSICHATNWDRLHTHFMDIARKDFDRISPSSLAQLTLAQTYELLADGLESRLRSSQKDLEERRRLLVSLGTRAESGLDLNRLNEWVRSGVELSGQRGLYAELEKIPAFSEDPLRKKLRVLAHQLAGYGLINISDPENLAPAIDYHLIRLYMRTNRVYPRVSSDYDRCSAAYKTSLSVLMNIREAVEDAMWYTAAGAGLRMDELNHVEWQIARSFCVRDRPRCDEGPLAAKPVDAPMLEMSREQGGCPILAECRARSVPLLLTIEDPSSSKSYY